MKVILLTLAGSYIIAAYQGIRNNYGNMLSAIVDSSGLSIVSVSFILAVDQFLFGLAQPAFGILAARKGNHVVFVAGVALTVTGMLLIPLCTSALTLLLCLGVILSAGTGAISYGLIMGVITPKIPAKSVPAASGIVQAGSGVGTSVMSPIIETLLRTGGLMRGMFVLAVPIALTLPVSLLMDKKLPKAAAETGAPPAAERLPLKATLDMAFRNRTYLYLALGFFTCGFHMTLINNHIPTNIQSLGFSSEIAAYAISVYGIVTILGTIASGILSGKLRMKNLLGIYYGLRPLTILLFMFMSKNAITVIMFTAMFGLSGNATVPPVVGIITRAFGAANIAVLFGVVFVIHQIGGFFSAWLGGVCFDLTGSYAVIWFVSIALSITASAVSFAIKD